MKRVVGREMVMAALLLALILCSNVPLLSGQLRPLWDASEYFAPAQGLVADAARIGDWRLRRLARRALKETAPTGSAAVEHAA